MKNIEVPEVTFQFFKTAALEQKSSGEWRMHPFEVIAWLREGDAVLEYLNPALGKIRRKKDSVIRVAANETRHSVILSGKMVSSVAGFSFETRDGFNFLDHFSLPSELPENIQGKLRKALTHLETLENTPMDFLRKQILRTETGYSILSALLDAAEEKNFEPVRASGIESAARYLNRHFREPCDLRKIIQESGLSRAVFFRLFHRRFSCTPMEYLSRLRLRTAVAFLLNTTMNISEIGAASGWSDPYHFSRIFRMMTGVPPSEYRKNPER